MIEDFVSAQRAYEILSRRANERRLKNLAIVHEACRAICSDATSTLSIAEVARRALAKGGPGIKALYNAGGEIYRTLIAAHRFELASTASVKHGRLGPWARIDAPARARIHILETELRHTRNALAEAKRDLSRAKRSVRYRATSPEIRS